MMKRNVFWKRLMNQTVCFLCLIALCLVGGVLAAQEAQAAEVAQLKAGSSKSVTINSMHECVYNEGQIGMTANDAGWYHLTLTAKALPAFWRAYIWDKANTAAKVELKQFNQNSRTNIEFYINMKAGKSYRFGLYMADPDQAAFQAKLEYFGKSVGDAGPEIKTSWDKTTGTLTLTGTGAMWDDYDGFICLGHSWGFDIKHLVVGEGITNIGNGMFSNQYYLESVKLPSTLKCIGYYSFGWSDYFDNDATRDDEWDTFDESSLSGYKVVIPEGVTTIMTDAFAANTKVTLYMPKSVVKMDDIIYAAQRNSIYVYKGTYAETYAKERSYNVKYRKDSQTITTGKSSYSKVYGNDPFSLNAKAKTKLTYSSSDTTVATVSSEGKVTLKGIGKATITVKAASSTYYKSATKKVTVTVKPKATSITSLTAGSGSFTVKWAKRTTKTKGYQIRYSRSSTMSNANKITITSNLTLSKKVKGRTSGKKYYVQVRTYGVKGTTKYYSAWCTKKYITVK